MSVEKPNIVTFGDALLRTGDLDPVYIAMTKSDIDPDTLMRLCLAYWCLYHLGASATLAEIKQPAKFWAKLMEAAVNEGLKWPRGSERRHFRGKNAVDAVGYLARTYKTPQHAVFGMLGVNPSYTGAPTFSQVSKAAQSHVGFGPWIAFKIADMSERVLGFETDFADCELGIYKDPRQGAAAAYLERHHDVQGTLHVDGKPAQPWDYPLDDSQLKDTVAYYVTLWRRKRAKAPPRGDRLVNVQEIETIFCKYKSHLKGHYPVGKDTKEVGHGLHGWGDLAETLRANLPVNR